MPVALLAVLAGCAGSQDELAPSAATVSPAALQDEPQEAPSQPPPSVHPIDEADDNAPTDRHLDVFGPVLVNPSPDIDHRTRRSAAEALIEIGQPDAQQALEDALRSGQPLVVLAVAEALAEHPEPVEPLMDAVVAALSSDDALVLDNLALVLTAYGMDGLKAVSAVAADPDAPVEQRLGAIHALSAFSSRQAASELMGLLDPARDEPPALIAATAIGLERLSGMSHGSDVAAWHRWWETTKDLSSAEWQRLMVENLSERIDTLESRIARQDQANARLEQKLLTVCRELYPALSVDEQLQRLPALLDDDLAAIRRFAVERVARLLRDSVRIPPELETKLVERLGDESPEVRREVAQMLDFLHDDGLPEAIAAALPRETDQQIIRRYLTLLEKRPTRAALEPISRHLADEPRAEAALWRLVTSVELSDGERADTLAAVRDAYEVAADATLLRTLAFVADEQTTAALETRLDEEETEVKHGIATGFAARDHLQPLYDRAADSTLFGILVQTLARRDGDLETVQRVVHLVPPPDRVFRVGERGARALRRSHDGASPPDRRPPRCAALRRR